MRKESVMEYLVIYDSTGFIISQMAGSVREPVGIPFMWVEIPEGKTLVNIDTKKNPHEPVFEDIAPTELEVLGGKVQQLQNEITIQQDTNIMLLEAMADVYEEVLPFLPAKK